MLAEVVTPVSVPLLQAALNIETSVSRMGFYGQQAEKLWCQSSTEGLHLWEWAAACDEEATGGHCGEHIC